MSQASKRRGTSLYRCRRFMGSAANSLPELFSTNDVTSPILLMTALTWLFSSTMPSEVSVARTSAAALSLSAQLSFPASVGATLPDLSVPSVGTREIAPQEGIVTSAFTFPSIVCTGTSSPTRVLAPFRNRSGSSTSAWRSKLKEFHTVTACPSICFVKAARAFSFISSAEACSA